MSDYTFVEYIAGGNGQYINTGYFPKSSTEISVEFSLDGSVGTWPCLMGTQSGTNADMFSIYFNWNSNIAYHRGSVSAGGTYYFINLGTKYPLKTDKEKLYFNNGVVVTLTDYQVTCRFPLYISALNNAGNPASQMPAHKIYDLQIFESGTLIKYFKPVKRNSDNKAGLLEVLSNTFYYSESGADYTAGPEITINYYTVIYNGNGGTGVMPTQNITVDVETPLTQNAYTHGELQFSGWSTNRSGPVEYANQEPVLNIAEPGNVITLYAIWIIPPMEIDLQYNASEKNRVDKNITTIQTLLGSLKNETSILTPVIIIEGDLDTISQCNYMTIPKFRRKYFITNIRSIRTGIIEISAKVDVLSTYANELRECTAIVQRQEGNWNLYLNDGSFRVYQNPQVITKEFPSGFTGHSFILAVAGG